MREVTQSDLALVNEENMKKLSGRYVFHYNDPKQTEGNRISHVHELAISNLGNSEIRAFKGLNPGVTTYGHQLKLGKDFEIIIASVWKSSSLQRN